MNGFYHLLIFPLGCWPSIIDFKHFLCIRDICLSSYMTQFFLWVCCLPLNFAYIIFWHAEYYNVIESYLVIFIYSFVFGVIPRILSLLWDCVFVFTFNFSYHLEFMLTKFTPKYLTNVSASSLSHWLELSSLSYTTLVCPLGAVSVLSFLIPWSDCLFLCWNHAVLTIVALKTFKYPAGQVLHYSFSFFQNYLGY